MKNNISTDDALTNMMRFMKFKKVEPVKKEKHYFKKWCDGESLFENKKIPMQEIGKNYKKEKIIIK